MLRLDRGKKRVVGRVPAGTLAARFNVTDNAPERELYRTTREQIALIEGLDGWAEEEIFPILKGPTCA